ncbi:T9SS type A sorting domain-containing protein [Dyadobacter luticola]|uniref:T9SS type A sorting domain-containing protein n=1 Tax=Dyadobacter luticola TaxID=1979387 RepID=A0A5R9L5A0_9BACT|nr:T9SS type A sorting domain-containing protein [Dyadobacter luticola]TLV03581.1 T9SS type A sorting domain-containing protein [Dyadobacter luticola]
MRFRLYGCCLALLVPLTNPCFSQIPAKPKTLQSPTAANFDQHGNIPVSLFTGKPEINIPLYQVSNQEPDIPIELQYDASGVRPDAHPSWVGLNFNLSTNYAVIRTIRDGPDDCPYQDSRGKLGYFFTANLVNDNNWNTAAGIKSIADNSTLGRDMEPDEYTFNLPGIAGKFYWGHDGKFKVACDRPVKVEWSSLAMDTKPPFTPPSNQVDVFSIWKGKPNYREHAKGFIITDELGIRYEFGGTNAYMEYGIDFFAQGSETWNCNAWYLKSITRATGQVTDFSYERGPMIAQMYFSLYQAQYKVNGGGFLDASCSANPSLFPVSGPINGKLISPIYLKEITGTNYKIKFLSSQSTELRYDENIFSAYVNWNKDQFGGNSRTLDILTYLYPCFYPPETATPGCVETNPPLSSLLAALQWKKLDKIQVQSAAGTTIKEFEFTYNNLATERLMLQKVQEKSGAKALPPHEFTYFTSPAIALPPYARSHTDHWGFNNAKLIAAADFSIANFFNNYGATFRSPDADSKYVKLGSLIKIKYPTGGMTEFTFEPHTYSKEVKEKRWLGFDTYAADKLSGGLRIKQIKTYDPNIAGSEMTKSYAYVSGFNAAAPNAALLSSGVLGGKAQYYWPGYQPKPDGNFTYTEDVFSTQSVLPGSENSYGSHIGYSEVVEATSTGGWTVYKFTNFDNGYPDAAPSGTLQSSSTAYQPYNSNAFQRGKKISEEHYLQNGSLAGKTTFQYSLIGNLTDYSARAERTLVRLLCDGDNRVYEGTAYLIDVRKFLPTQESNITYDQDSPAQYSSTFTKNYQYWPNGQLHIEGHLNSDGKELKTWYVYPANLNDPVSVAMIAKNMIGKPTSVFHYTGTEMQPVALKLHNVIFGLFNGLYLPKKVESGVGTALPMAMVTDIDFLTYDARGNLLTYKERNGSTTKLDYYGAADIGKTDLLKQRTDFDGTTLPGVTTFTHKPVVGMESFSDANAKTIFYEYDDFGRLKNVRTASAGGAVRVSYCYNYAGQLVDCAALAPTGSIAAGSLSLLSDAALPVTLLEFEAFAQEKIVLLKWSTSMETNSDHFDIERSSDGKRWIKIGSEKAFGESDTLKSYDFVDLKPLAGENLYRLKMIDTDSSFAYSRLRSVLVDDPEKLILYPNPVIVENSIQLQTDDLGQIRDITVFDSSGKSVLKSAAAGSIKVAHLAAGIYIVQITYTDGSIRTQRIVKQ